MSSVSDRDNFKLTKSVLTTGRANKLFVWSSSDSYIQEKKRQLQLRKSTEGKPSSQSHKPSAPAEDKPVETDAKFSTLQSELHLRLSTEKVNNKLSKSIEIEANKFIHARIQKIRDHHSEQMMKQINERKRKDHEIYLQRLKLKEEEYEKSIRQDQDQDQVGTKKLNFLKPCLDLGVVQCHQTLMMRMSPLPIAPLQKTLLSLQRVNVQLYLGCSHCFLAVMVQRNE